MVVEKSIKNLENSQALLTIKVDAQSIADAYQKKLAKYQKDILMDGFRKGKAPLSLIERKYGDMIYEESTFEELESLAGVGHKTASVLMSQAFGVPAFPVDTHIKAMLKRYPKGFPFERYQGFAGVLQQYAFYKETRQWQ